MRTLKALAPYYYQQRALGHSTQEVGKLILKINALPADKKAGFYAEEIFLMRSTINQLRNDQLAKGQYTDAADTLYQKMRKNSKAKKAAKTEDRQVYERSLFPGIFDTTAQEAYMENTAAYEQLFLDADKYQAVMRALADRLYKELHDSK